ncbi:hypothetical protein HK101_004495, partial [Irineochytrium annulatum]
KATSRFLRRLGLGVETYVTAGQCLDGMRGGHGGGIGGMGVIVVDLDTVDGVELARDVRELETGVAGAGRLMVGVTGRVEGGRVREALSAGLDCVLTKPWRRDDLACLCGKAGST